MVCVASDMMAAALGALFVLGSVGAATLLAPGALPGILAEAELRCDPLAFGAKGDGASDNAAALQRAIDTCSAQAKGRHFVLELPPGTFLAGSFRLASNMTLRLSRGTVVAASAAVDAYPLIAPFPSFGVGRDVAKDVTRQHAALICGYNVTRVVIEGSGKDSVDDGLVDGRGQPWWDRFNNKTLQFTRPRLIEFMYSEDVVVRDLRVRDSPFWNTHFYATKDILIEGLNMTSPFLAPNSDGLDLDSVHNATVRHCDIGVGDDAVAIKSGLDQYGVDFGFPSTKIHLKDLRVYAKCISIGSEMSGGVRDVLVENVLFGDARPENIWHSIFVKSTRDRGGYIRDILFRNISTVVGGTHELMTAFLEVTMYYGTGHHESPRPAAKPPLFRNISFESIFVDGTRQVVNVKGLADSLIEDVRIKGLTARHYDVGILCGNATGIAISDTDVPAKGCGAQRGSAVGYI